MHCLASLHLIFTILQLLVSLRRESTGELLIVMSSRTQTANARPDEFLMLFGFGLTTLLRCIDPAPYYPYRQRYGRVEESYIFRSMKEGRV